MTYFSEMEGWGSNFARNQEIYDVVKGAEQKTIFLICKENMFILTIWCR